MNPLPMANKQSLMVNSNLFLWGFHGKKFRFWNETTGELAFEHTSGGANRIWDFYVPSEACGDHLADAVRKAWFVYTSKAEVCNLGVLYLPQLYFRRVGRRIMQKTVAQGSHGREIRCMAVQPGSSGEALLASGSEDTYINFAECICMPRR